MATATTGTFNQFKILIGDGATPTEVFTPICGLTSRGLTGSADVVTSEVPDCTNEDLPSWQEKDVKSIGMSLSGSGMWAQESHEMLLQWFLTGAKKNIKVQYANADTGDVEFLAGPAVITQLNNAAEKGGRISAEISLEFTAKPTTADAS